MWIPGSGESPALSEAQEDRSLLHPCHHKHVAVCQQETLAFIELQPSVTPKLNGHGCPRPTVIPDVQCTTHPSPLNGYSCTLNELNDMQNSCQRTELETKSNEHETKLNLNSCTPVDDGVLECQDGIRTSLQEQTEKPQTVTTVCRPLHSALSLPLSFPLSSIYTNRDSWDSQLLCSPSSPEFQSPDCNMPQRRTSQGSLKEKSIRECCAVFDS